MLHGSRGWPLEVNFKNELDEDVDMPYDELALFCQQLLEKYDCSKGIIKDWKINMILF